MVVVDDQLPRRPRSQIDDDRRQLRERGFPSLGPPPLALQVRTIIKSVAAPLGRQPQPLVLEALALPGNAARLLLLRSGHPHHTEGVAIAVLDLTAIGQNLTIDQ